MCCFLEKVFIFARDNTSISFLSDVIVGVSCVRERWQLFQVLLFVAFVVYSSPHMVVFPNSDLNNFKAWNIEVSDEELDRLS